MKKRLHSETSSAAHDSVKPFKEEEWSVVLGYEGRFMISSFGRIKSLSREVHRRDNSKHITKDIIKKHRVNKFGYETNILWIGKKGKHFMVHRLVAFAFIPNPNNKKFVNHKDGNKLNNHVSNLEWVTDSENKKHAYANGLMSQKGEAHASNKLTNEIIFKVLESTEMPGILAKRYGVTTTSISNIRTGNTWSHITKIKKSV